MQRITIIRYRVPQQENVNVQLQWLGNSLGLFGTRDKDKSCFRIFIELLKETKKGTSLTSDELASRLNLSRGTVVHHLHKLKDSGIIVYEDNGYLLRVNSLSQLIAELEQDTLRTLSILKKVANDIDTSLN